jgi:hypothetical protein
LILRTLAKYAVSRYWRLQSRAEKERLSGCSPIHVPTYDGAPSMGHSDVLDTGPECWNGWRYWMAFTPYPPAERENPSIVVSNDGINWAEPGGSTNPVVSRFEAQQEGFVYNSDPELVLLSNRELALYYRPIYGENSEGIYRKTSSDGIVWSTAERLLVSPRGFRLLSPAVVVEPDESLTMWTVNTEAKRRDRRVERRTSSDGVSWSDPQPCQIPRGVTPWHLDVLRAGGLYRLLLTSCRPWRLYYWTSGDGYAWEGSADPIPLSGALWDQDGHYRSSFAPRADHVFDLWPTGMDASRSGGDIWRAEWRIGYAKSVKLR